MRKKSTILIVGFITFFLDAIAVAVILMDKPINTWFFLAPAMVGIIYMAWAYVTRTTS